MWLNHANKSHRTKIIITKNTILGAKKSFFFTKQFEPRIIKQSKKNIQLTCKYRMWLKHTNKSHRKQK